MFVPLGKINGNIKIEIFFVCPSVLKCELYIQKLSTDSGAHCGWNHGSLRVVKIKPSQCSVLRKG